jgi:uncharacterized protein (TIGR02594 family)
MTPLEIALTQYGQKEIAGEKDNTVIVKYAKDIGMDWVKHDETAWCAIFVNWCFLKSGFDFKWKANARSWLLQGQMTDTPALGDVVIFKRGNSAWQGHVGFYINETHGYINVLGGNQSNQVKISMYLKSKVLGFRRFKKL